MSVSLFAFSLQFGHLTNSHSSCLFRGLPGKSKAIFLGNLTGRLSFFSGTIPHFSQCIIGIGHPQYRCLDIPHSIKREFVFSVPTPNSLNQVETVYFGSSIDKPSKKSELTKFPGPV